MADDVDEDRDALETLTVVVAEYHLMAVKERIVVIAVEMDTSAERHAIVVNRVALENVSIMRVRSQKTSDSFNDFLVATLIRISYNISRQLLSMLGIVDRDVSLAS